MIVCHCNSITDKEIEAAVEWMRAADPDTIITPGRVYHALGKKVDCGGCLPQLIDTMRQNDKFAVPRELRGLRRATLEGDANEGRR
ncbi:(2Fe-2S)-binding protein [Roseovarius salinarum]|uniref:(2Fe-2S)-binding protein n=1 Tax=Roseovarius salinarum TaxID=1981892 RepID=UPI000C3348F9|nr:(2Fe-2S)-binding protein [Roseovarius salinarum]